VIVAVAGVVSGISLGAVLGVGAQAILPVSLRGDLTVPVGTIATFTAFALLLALVASALPAERAARTPVLEALTR
jgi:ABC-type lipoprotein release transport system permease subunit